MNKKQANIILNLILMVGLAVYILLATTNNISQATIWTIFVLYFWVFLSLYLNSFDFQKLLKICCWAGLLFAMTIFFMFGLEEIPYPEGAIIFHAQPIAASLIMFFFSSLPLIYKLTSKQKEANNSSQKSQNKENIENKEAWEAATLDDINSGEYEPI